MNSYLYAFRMLFCKLRPVIHGIVFVNRGEEGKLGKQQHINEDNLICFVNNNNCVIYTHNPWPTWCKARAISKVPTVSMLAAMMGIPL